MSLARLLRGYIFHAGPPQPSAALADEIIQRIPQSALPLCHHHRLGAIGIGLVHVSGSYCCRDAGAGSARMDLLNLHHLSAAASANDRPDERVPPFAASHTPPPRGPPALRANT